MEEELTKIFRQARLAPGDSLASDIWQKMLARNKRNTVLKFWTFTLISIGSITALVPAFNLLSRDLAQSGFYEYFSLIFNNNSALSLYKEIGLSITESLPVMSIVLSLSLVLVLCLSLKYVAKQIINNQLSLTRSF